MVVASSASPRACRGPGSPVRGLRVVCEVGRRGPNGPFTPKRQPQPNDEPEAEAPHPRGRSCRRRSPPTGTRPIGPRRPGGRSRRGSLLRGLHRHALRPRPRRTPPTAEPRLGANPRIHHRGTPIPALHRVRSPRRRPTPGARSGPGGPQPSPWSPLPGALTLLELTLLEHRHSVWNDIQKAVASGSCFRVIDRVGTRAGEDSSLWTWTWSGTGGPGPVARTSHHSHVRICREELAVHQAWPVCRRILPGRPHQSSPPSTRTGEARFSLVPSPS